MRNLCNASVKVVVVVPWHAIIYHCLNGAIILISCGCSEKKHEFLRHHERNVNHLEKKMKFVKLTCDRTDIERVFQELSM